jgi:hypothetical protein
LVARYYNKSPWDFLGNNNTWFYVLLFATAITFVIACFNFGPAILLPENVPSQEQRGGLGYFFNHLLHGTNAPARSVPTNPLPWATGTWFWWKAFLVYFFFMIAYFPFAFWDEVGNFYKGVKTLIKRHHDEAIAERHAAHAVAVTQAKENKTPIPQAPPAKLRFLEFVKWDLLVELGEAFLKLLIKGKI